MSPMVRSSYFVSAKAAARSLTRPVQKEKECGLAGQTPLPPHFPCTAERSAAIMPMIHARGLVVQVWRYKTALLKCMAAPSAITMRKMPGLTTAVVVYARIPVAHLRCTAVSSVIINP